MKIKSYTIIFPILIFSILMNCKKEKTDNLNPISENNISNSTEQKNTEPENDSIKKAQEKAEEKEKPETGFSTIVFTKENRDSLMSVFNKKYSAKERYTILALNRLDTKNQWRADTLVIPAKISENFLDYSPFPYHLEILNDVKQMVLFSYPIQAFAVYNNGVLVKWGPTSMGKKAAQTNRGLMFTNWKKKLAISTVDDEWKLPYNVNIQNMQGIGWHQYDLPGFPASHSCLRLLMEDAEWLYSYADMWILNEGGGTVRANGIPVIVFGDYAWGKRKPWKILDKNPKNTDISEEQLTEIIQPNLDKILEEQKKREEVLIEVQQEKEEAALRKSQETNEN